MLPNEEQHLIDLAARRLAEKHPDLPLAVVGDAVTRARDHLADRPIRDFVPLLIERAAEAELSRTNAGAATAHAGTGAGAGDLRPVADGGRGPGGRHRKL